MAWASKLIIGGGTTSSGLVAGANAPGADYGVIPVWSAATGAWTSPETLEIHSFIRDGIHRDIWTVDFADPAEPLKNRQICVNFRPAKPRFLAADAAV